MSHHCQPQTCLMLCLVRLRVCSPYTQQLQHPGLQSFTSLGCRSLSSVDRIRRGSNVCRIPPPRTALRQYPIGGGFTLNVISRFTSEYELAFCKLILNHIVFYSSHTQSWLQLHEFVSPAASVSVSGCIHTYPYHGAWQNHSGFTENCCSFMTLLLAKFFF